jgi:branched-chain amino acid transport system substrate-binding protein
VSFDDRQTAINNIYIKGRKRCSAPTRRSCGIRSSRTDPNVSQFWTYDKAAFLKQPLYSRDFPPCRFCE